MKQFLRDYFTFNRKERNGVFILLSIILLLILCLTFSDIFFPKEKIDFSEFEKEIADFETELKRVEDSVADARENYKAYNNNQDKDSSRNHYQPYKKHFPLSDVKGEAKIIIVELNSADTTALKTLKGIGSAFAKRIVKFRESLGGFTKKEQLLEVYGFDKEKYDLAYPQIEIDHSSVKKININSASVDDLDKHPYIDKKTAVKIFFQRVNHGNYTDVSDVLKLNLADEEVYGKIAPYLTAK